MIPVQVLKNVCKGIINLHKKSDFLIWSCSQRHVFFANASDCPYSNERSGASVKTARENLRACEARTSHSRITLTVLPTFWKHAKTTVLQSKPSHLERICLVWKNPDLYPHHCKVILNSKKKTFKCSKEKQNLSNFLNLKTHFGLTYLVTQSATTFTNPFIHLIIDHPMCLWMR